MLDIKAKYSMWTNVIPFPPSSLYISYETTYFHNILMKSFLSRFSLIRVYLHVIFSNFYLQAFMI
jgi:hypothetical protein